RDALIVSLPIEMEKELRKNSPEKADLVMGGFFRVQPDQVLGRCSFNLMEKNVRIVGTKPFFKKAKKVKKIVFGQGFKLDMKRIQGTTSFELVGGVKAEKPKVEEKKCEEKEEVKPVEPIKKPEKPKIQPEPSKEIEKPKKRARKRRKKTQSQKDNQTKSVQDKKPGKKIIKIKAQKVKSKNPKQTIKQLSEIYG
ncbi:hypothetical protein KY342_01705, partial [Candidatus Woesearchaeota archaeon]|nr:hypothetical protein [Candidatus Woesearchaeota archaeon]